METFKPVAPEFLIPELVRNTDTLYRIDGGAERFYYRLNPTGGIDFYGSITSLKKQVTPMAKPIIDKMIELGKDFDAYRNNKAHFGTFWHIQAAELTINRSYDFKQLDVRIASYAASHADCGDTSWWFETAWKGLLSWAQCMQDFDIQPEAVEIPLWHPDGYAGTTDLVCTKWEDKYTDKTPDNKRIRVRAIIDWKTGGIYDDHAIQLELNKKTWDFHFPHMPISQLFNWSPTDWRKTPGYEFKNQTGKESDNIDLLVALWKVKGVKKPYDKRQLLIDLLTLDTDLSTAWKHRTIEEILLEKHARKDAP